MPEHAIDWNEATVADGVLTAPVDPPADRAWRGVAKAVLAELTNVKEQWGGVQVKKAGFVVADAGDQDAEELRFFLEGIVQQANAALHADEPSNEPPGPDAELTATYRAFGSDPDSS